LRWALAIGRTPRELLAGVTSQDVTEMLAFERLEPFGSLHQEFMAGQICAAVTSPHLQKDASVSPSDFMPTLRAALAGYSKPKPVVLTVDQEIALADAAIFGRLMVDKPIED
jgi:hypothetical protein